MLNKVFNYFDYSTRVIHLQQLPFIKYLTLLTAEDKESATSNIPYSRLHIPCECNKEASETCYFCVDPEAFNLQIQGIGTHLDYHYKNHIQTECAEWLKIEHLDYKNLTTGINIAIHEIESFPHDIKYFLVREYIQPLIEEERMLKTAVFWYMAFQAPRFNIPVLLQKLHYEELYWDLLQVRRKIYWRDICGCHDRYSYSRPRCESNDHRYTWKWSKKYLEVIQDPELIYHCGKNMRKSWLRYIKKYDPQTRIEELYKENTERTKLAKSDLAYQKILRRMIPEGVKPQIVVVSTRNTAYYSDVKNS